jgi:hypothetical protein
MPKFTYSRLIAIRVSHSDPIQLAHIALVVQQELEKVFPEWSSALPEPKPQIEAFAVGMEDFPMKEVS